jgi:hypothetical protein
MRTQWLDNVLLYNFFLKDPYKPPSPEESLEFSKLARHLEVYAGRLLHTRYTYHDARDYVQRSCENFIKKIRKDGFNPSGEATITYYLKLIYDKHMER